MSELTRIDQVLAILRRKQACGGMSYQKAVDTETLICAFERMRGSAIAADDAAIGPVSPKPRETALDVFLRGIEIGSMSKDPGRDRDRGR